MTFNTAARLLVFSDDWGRHPSSCQHLIGNMLPKSSVTWVNTIAMRPPRLDWVTIQRGHQKLREWNRDSLDRDPSLPTGLKILEPKMWPWMKHRWDRWLNRELLVRQLKLASADAIAVTTIPIVSDLIGYLPVRAWIYYCVDDFSLWPGLDGQTLGRMEDELLPKVDGIIAASKNLADGIAARGFDSTVITHGVDRQFWQSDLRHGFELLEGVEHPVCLFWGVIDQRMNADWLLSLADSMHRGTIMLVGPQQNPDRRLRDHDRIEMPGAIAMECLPTMASQAQVLVMPYADLPVTRAMQPLKLKEYLATGQPVVVSPLPAVREWAMYLDVANSREDFVARTMKHLYGEPSINPNMDALNAAMEQESWQSKSNDFARFVCESVDSVVRKRDTGRSI